MIDWDKTYKEYGYNEATVKTRQPIVVRCNNCNETFEVLYFKYRKEIIDSRKCNSCTTTSLWKNRQYQSKVSDGVSKWAKKNNIKPSFDPREAAKIAWGREEYRKTISECTKRSWQDPQYRDLKSKQSKAWWTEDRKRKFGDWSREQWKK